MSGIVTGRRTTSTTVSPADGDRLLTVDTRHGRFEVRWRATETVGYADVTVAHVGSVYDDGSVPTASMHVGSLQVWQLVSGRWSPSHLVALAAAVDHWGYVEELWQSQADYAAEHDTVLREDRAVQA